MVTSHMSWFWVLKWEEWEDKLSSYGMGKMFGLTFGLKNSQKIQIEE